MEQSIFLVLFLSLSSTILGVNIELDSGIYETYATIVDRDTAIITNAIKNIVGRPDFSKYPYVIEANSSEVPNPPKKHKKEVILKYVTPNSGSYGDEGIISGNRLKDDETYIRFNNLDLREDLIIFPVGGRGVGNTLRTSVYFVLRKRDPSSKEKGPKVREKFDEDKPLYYLAIAYVRNVRKQYLVEWNIIQHNFFGKNRVELDLCRNERCDISHYIFGTCSVASAKCPTPLKDIDTSDPILRKYTWKTNMEDSDMDLEPGSSIWAATAELSTKTTFTTNLTTAAAKPNVVLKSVINLSNTTKDAKSHSTVTGSGKNNHTQNVTNEAKSIKVLLVFSETSTHRPSTKSPSKTKPKSRGRHGRDLTAIEAKNRTKDSDAPIPNSLDLLVLKRDDDSDDDADVDDSDKHFDNALVGTRATGIYLGDEGEECKGCETLGDFFDDFQEEKEMSKLIGEMIKSRKDELLGEEFVTKELISLHPGVPFIGFGHCDYSNDREDNFSEGKTKELDDLTNLYTHSLRLDCDNAMENRIRSLFTSKMRLLEVMEDFSVGISADSFLLKYRILTTHEFKSFMASLILSKFTQEYRRTKDGSTTKEVSALGEKGISKEIRFITKLLLSVTDALTKKYSQHFVRGLRHLNRMLKDKFLVLLSNFYNQNNSSTMSKEKKIEEIKDLYQIMGLKEFLLFGLGPTVKSGSSTEPAFKSFYYANRKRIRTLVKAYAA